MAQLTEQQYWIGCLPWTEVDRGSPRQQFARLDLSVVPDKSRAMLEVALAHNGVSASRLPGSPGFLQVSLADQSGKNLDILRMAATNWASPNNDNHKLVAVGNEMHDQDFLKIARNSGSRIDAVLGGLKQLHARYGVPLHVESGADGKPYLVASAEQAAQLSNLKALPLALDNLPYDHTVEAAKARQFAEAKPTTSGRAVTGAAFGAVASIPAMMETYELAEQDVKNGQVPVAAANHATKLAAEAVVGSAAGGAVAVTAAPLLALPPPAGEIAYGAAVLGAGYLGAEATKQLMEQADYYMAKAKTYFQSDKKQEVFNAHIENNAIKAGLNPEVAVVYANKAFVNEVEAKLAHLTSSHQGQGVEP